MWHVDHEIDAWFDALKQEDKDKRDDREVVPLEQNELTAGLRRRAS